MSELSEVEPHHPPVHHSFNEKPSIYHRRIIADANSSGNEHKDPEILGLTRLPNAQGHTEHTQPPRQEAIGSQRKKAAMTCSIALSSSSGKVAANGIHVRTPADHNDEVVSLNKTFNVRSVLSESVRGPLIDSVPIIIPDDDLCQNDQIEIQMKVDHPAYENPTPMKDLNGTLVQLTSSTYIQLIEASEELPLGFSFPTRYTAVFRNSSVPLRVNFSSNEIQICDGKTVLFTKPYETLLSCRLAVSWFVQLLHELQNVTKPRSKFGNDNIRPLRIEAKGHHQNGQLKRRLYEGAFFKVNQQFSKGKLFGQRIHFRGVQIGIPITADPATVYLQAFLMPEDQRHLHPCVTQGRPSDPANRLGLRVQYRTLSGSSEEYWVRLNGDQNVFKINSLVDFLEEKDIDFTEGQERRFLNHRTSLGRYSKTEYTNSSERTTDSGTQSEDSGPKEREESEA